MNNVIPLIAFSLLVAAQFLAVIYCVHHYRQQSPQDVEDQKSPGNSRPAGGNTCRILTPPNAIKNRLAQNHLT